MLYAQDPSKFKEWEAFIQNVPLALKAEVISNKELGQSLTLSLSLSLSPSMSLSVSFSLSLSVSLSPSLSLSLSPCVSV